MNDFSSDIDRPNAAVQIQSPVSGIVLDSLTTPGQNIVKGQLIALIESMKVHIRIEAEEAGKIIEVPILEGDIVETGDIIALYRKTAEKTVITPASLPKDKRDRKDREDRSEPNKDNSNTSQNEDHPSFDQWQTRSALADDKNRQDAVLKRHKKGYQTARENLERLCAPQSFIEYGRLAVAAQRQREDYDTLKSKTAADGVITGIGKIDGKPTALIINDYSVLAGTQGFFHHQKIDRMLDVAKQKKLPVVMFTEGGGGRPGDTDVLTVNSGLQCSSFSTWAGLQGVVPRIAVANGYNFAGNAALFGAADITIATKSSWIGMAGPAMVSGGGLGDFKPTDIGPIEVQSQNGVVDIVVEDEQEACRIVKKLISCLDHETNSIPQNIKTTDQTRLRKLIPSNRKEAYSIREIIRTISDCDSYIELQEHFGKAMIVGITKINGNSIGVMANDCTHIGGAIDSDAGQKAARFLRLCERLHLPVVSFCDTPGFMVGPKHEENGAVRKLADLFAVGANLKVPFYAVVVRKCYGLGAQAMLGGSTLRPDCTLAWPSGEFGAMGLEGAVHLGFKKELDAQPDAAAKSTLFDELLSEQYQKGKATEVASVLELDAVIDPATTRNVLTQLLES